MTTKRITAGWRGLSTAKESALGTAATVDESFNFEGEPTDIEVNAQETNESEVTGYNEPTAKEILNYKLDSSHEQRALPHNIAQFLGMVMGKVTTDKPDNVGNAAVYRHWFERDLTNVALPSFTLIENDGIATKQFTGIFGKTFKLIGARGDFIQMVCEFGGMGKEEASAVTKPAQIVESYLRYGDVDFLRGGSLTGTVAGGDLAHGSGTSFKADLRSFEWMIDNQAEAIYELGDSSGYVSRVERGDRFVQTLNAVLEMQDDSHKTGLTAGTEYVISIPIVGSAITGVDTDGSLFYTAEIILPKVVYRGAKKGRDAEKMIVNAEFEVLEDTTHGSAIVKVQNKQVAYLT